jgi:hypothetical protein
MDAVLLTPMRPRPLPRLRPRLRGRAFRGRPAVTENIKLKQICETPYQGRLGPGGLVKMTVTGRCRARYQATVRARKLLQSCIKCLANSGVRKICFMYQNKESEGRKGGIRGLDWRMWRQHKPKILCDERSILLPVCVSRLECNGKVLLTYLCLF